MWQTKDEMKCENVKWKMWWYKEDFKCIMKLTRIQRIHVSLFRPTMTNNKLKRVELRNGSRMKDLEWIMNDKQFELQFSSLFTGPNLFLANWSRTQQLGSRKVQTTAHGFVVTSEFKQLNNSQKQTRLPKESMHLSINSCLHPFQQFFEFMTS